jgi:hypothetical protein
MDADVELLARIQAEILPGPGRRVFVIGNAFGYSTIIVGLLFASQSNGDGGRGNGFVGGGRGGASSSGSVDVIDAETEASCNHVGSMLTRSVANASRLDVALSSGMSPQDVPGAMRSPRYDLAFIDGEHTGPQLAKDFAVVAPRMAPRGVVVLHDVGFFNLHEAVAGLPPEWHRHAVRGRAYKNLVGTVLLHRGFPQGSFDDF